ncbi:MAG: hypothetical protein ACQEQ7_01160 [Thermodesulfobacteriota bacterium]
MPAILRSEFKRMMENMTHMEKDLTTLKGDYSAWANDVQAIDLKHILRHARDLKQNLDITFSDWHIACRRYWKDYNIPVAGGLRKALVFMDCICKELEDMHQGYHNKENRFGLFKELYMDWEEFKRCIYHTQALINEPQERRKNFHWIHEGDRKEHLK